MKIKVQDVSLKIARNESNTKSFWNPIGMFHNPSKVEKDGKWYKCYISFIEKDSQSFIRISDLMTTNGDTITSHERGLYKELPVSNFKKFLIEVLLNSHPLNFKWFYFRKTLYGRRNTIFVFSASIAMALGYYFGNEYYNGAWQKFIAENSIIQAVFMLLTIFSVGSVFFPFTIQKQLNEKDIRAICQEEAKKFDKDKETNKRIEENASF